MIKFRASKAAWLACFAASAVFFIFYLILRTVPLDIDTHRLDSITWAIAAQLKQMRLGAALQALRPSSWFANLPGDSLVSLPFALIFGTEARMAFWRGFLEALPALWLTAVLARRFYGDLAAAASCLLLAASPSFVLYSRWALLDSVIQVPLLLLVLWALVDWLEAGRSLSALLACFALGLGLGCRSKFLAAAAGAAAVVWINRRRAGELLPKPLGRRILWLAWGLAAAAVFVAPLTLLGMRFESNAGGLFIRHLIIRVDHTSNFSFGANFMVRLRQISQLLDGTADTALLTGISRTLDAVPGSAVIWAALAAGFWSFVRRISAGGERWRREASLWVMTAAWLLFSLLSPTELAPHHLLPLLPLVLILACSWLGAIRAPALKRFFLAAALFFCGLRTIYGYSLLSNLAAQAHPKYGIGCRDALADWAREHPARHLVLISQSSAYFYGNFPFSWLCWDDATSGEPRVSRIDERCDLLLSDPSNVYVLFYRNGKPSPFGARHWACLRGEARAKGLRLRPVKVLRGPDGALLAVFYQARRPKF